MSGITTSNQAVITVKIVTDFIKNLQTNSKIETCCTKVKPSFCPDAGQPTEISFDLDKVEKSIVHML